MGDVMGKSDHAPRRALTCTNGVHTAFPEPRLPEFDRNEENVTNIESVIVWFHLHPHENSDLNRSLGEAAMMHRKR
jgi:hypothetical protein